MKCKNAATHALVRQARAEARKGRICPMCGGPVSDDVRADTIYCSKLCQRRASKAYARGKREKTCAHCGKPFFAHRDAQRFCSVQCGHKAAPIEPKPCAHCGAMFKGRQGQRFCGKACATAARWTAGTMTLPPGRGKG